MTSTRPKSSGLTFLSLFAGIGGIDKGLEDSGLRCVAQVEIDPFCRAVLAKHWPDVPRFNDVTKFCRRCADCEPENEDGEVICPRCEIEFGDCECIGTDQFTDECGVPDVVAAGVPCQPSSVAGRRRGTGDERWLWDEMLRVVRELHPRWIILENPTGVVRVNDGDGFRSILNGLASCGFDAWWDCVPAAAIGAPHLRRRIFIVANSAGGGCEPTRSGLRQGIAGEIGRGRSGDQDKQVLSISECQGLEGDEREEMERERERRHDTDASRPGGWSATPRICRATDGIHNRVDRIRALGNAVVPQVVELIGRAIIEADRRLSA